MPLGAAHFPSGSVSTPRQAIRRGGCREPALDLSTPPTPRLEQLARAPEGPCSLQAVLLCTWTTLLPLYPVHTPCRLTNAEAEKAAIDVFVAAPQTLMCSFGA